MGIEVTASDAQATNFDLLRDFQSNELIESDASPTNQLVNDYQSKDAVFQLQNQNAHTRYGLFQAHAQLASFSGAAPTANAPKSVNDPVIGLFTSQQRAAAGPYRIPGANPAPPGPGDLAFADAAKNGQTHRIVAQNANPKNTPVIYVNGIQTDFKRAQATAAEISRLTGSPVDLAYNASSLNVALNKTKGHFTAIARRQATAAAAQSLPKFMPAAAKNAWIEAHTNAGVAGFALSPQAPAWAKRNALQNPPTAQTTANLIAAQLKNTKGPVNVVAYSQGGAITAEALRTLSAKGVDVSRVRVLGIGAAANKSDYPPTVRLSGFAHKTDVVAQYFGENRRNFNAATNLNRETVRLTSPFADLKDIGNFVQHSNYFRVGSGSYRADTAARGLLQDWSKGTEVPFRVLPDVR